MDVLTNGPAVGFADIDAFNIELATLGPQENRPHLHAAGTHVQRHQPEAIKSPEYFHILEEFRRTMRMPVSHDDPHFGSTILISWRMAKCWFPNPEAGKVAGKLLARVGGGADREA